MNSQFQSFQDFMIQYLPHEVVAGAQHIFQQSNTPQPNTQQNHMQGNDVVQHDSNHDGQQNSPAQDYNNY